MALKEAVKRETQGAGVDIQMSESPVDEHQANGVIENAVREVQEQVRTMRLAMERRYDMKLSENHPIWPWIIIEAAAQINRYRVGQDGKTAFQRLRGKNFNKGVTEMAEIIDYLQLASEGRDKADTRWSRGVYLGINDRTGEVVIGTENGITKARTFRRIADPKERWNREELDKVKQPPWEPEPGREDGEIRIRVGIPEEPDIRPEMPEPMEMAKARRNFYITRADIDKHGFHPGPNKCYGCQAINRGVAGRASHIAECRDRVFDKMYEAGEKRAVDKVEEELIRDSNTTIKITKKIREEQQQSKRKRDPAEADGVEEEAQREREEAEKLQDEENVPMDTREADNQQDEEDAPMQEITMIMSANREAAEKFGKWDRRWRENQEGASWKDGVEKMNKELTR